MKGHLKNCPSCMYWTGYSFFAVHFEGFTENYPFLFEGLQNILLGMWRAGPQNKDNSPSILLPAQRSGCRLGTTVHAMLGKASVRVHWAGFVLSAWWPQVWGVGEWARDCSLQFWYFPWLHCNTCAWLIDRDNITQPNTLNSGAEFDAAPGRFGWVGATKSNLIKH